jgi:hypothetical protein
MAFRKIVSSGSNERVCVDERMEELVRREKRREDEYIRRTGEMKGFRGLKRRYGGPAITTYTAWEIAKAWGCPKDVVARLGAVGLLGRQYYMQRERPRYSEAALKRALENPMVVQAITRGRKRRQIGVKTYAAYKQRKEDTARDARGVRGEEGGESLLRLEERGANRGRREAPHPDQAS